MGTHKINADLDIAGQLVALNSGTIGGSNLGNATILAGSTSTGIGIDSNEIVGKGDHLYIGAATNNKSIIFRTDATSNVLTLDSDQNATFTGSITIPDYIKHTSDGDTFFGFSDADVFKIHVGNEDVIRVNGGATSSEAAVSILCGGGSGATNVGLLLNGQTNGETLKLKMANPNTGGTNIGAGILSFEPDGDTFNIGQSTTHNNMAISIDNSENVTLINALTVTGNIVANGNIVGDDGTNISNIASIKADSYGADADNTTRIDMTADDINFLVQDTDVFQVTETDFVFDAAVKTSIKKRKFAKTNNTDGNADGDIVYFGSTTSMTAGKIYYYTSSSTWALADADSASTAKGLLGVALGSASNTNGVLLRGMVTLSNDSGTIGDAVFLSTTPGLAQSSAPTGNGDIARVVGYCLDNTNGQVYFNPDGTFVEVSA